MIGTTLAHYRVSAALGAGGMGEVWRAEDEKLGREVALKVLPEEFAGDPDRMARFEREAKVLASLNHPNIATLFGLDTRPVIPREAAGRVEGSMGIDSTGDDSPRPDPSLAALAQDDNRGRAEGNSKLKTQNSNLPGSAVTFLVMELVEGEDLSERIAFVIDAPPFHLYAGPADGSSEPVAVLESPIDSYAEAISPDGRWMVVRQSADGDYNLGLLELGGGPVLRPLRETQFAERFATVSPDGRYVAYESNESGRREVQIVLNWFTELERLAGPGGVR